MNKNLQHSDINCFTRQRGKKTRKRKHLQNIYVKKRSYSALWGFAFPSQCYEAEEKVHTKRELLCPTENTALPETPGVARHDPSNSSSDWLHPVHLIMCMCNSHHRLNRGQMSHYVVKTKC